MAGPDVDKFTLLIWEEIPENTRIYLIPDDKIDKRLRAVLNRANGQIINSSAQAQEGANVVTHLLIKEYPPDGDAIEYLADWDPAWLGLFENFRRDPTKDPILAGEFGLRITHIYHSGFML